MLKKGKKFLMLLLALALSAGTLAGCGKTLDRKPLEGYVPSDNAAESNGGFVVKKDSWYYFINGAEDYSADNTFGNVVKGSLMRISETDLANGDYSNTQIVVPQLIITQDYTSGVFIYGDYVYYATPNTTKNMEGQVESSYLDFKCTKLDGSETKKDYYVQLSDNSTPYRYVQENGTVYLLYADTSNKEIHSVNTSTGVNTVLVSGYSDYAFDTNVESGTVYYTMAVAKRNTYPNTSNESYNQLYKVNASATESAYEIDLSDGYTDSSKKEGDEGYEMEYVNLGTLVLDGIGSSKEYDVTPFNHDFKAGLSIKSALGYTYEIVKMTEGRVYLKITSLDQSSSPFIYALADADVKEGWNSVTSNPDLANPEGSALLPMAATTDAATETALYYVENDSQYYIYLDSNNVIHRIKVGSGAQYIAEDVALSRGQEGATLQYLKDGYLYFSKSGTNGNALWRIRYDGAQADYNRLEGTAADNDDYVATQYLKVDYNSSWYVPETLNGYLFFSNAESYASNYVYVMKDPADNNALADLNDKYQEVQDAFTDISKKFSNASNASKYYYYTGSTQTIYEADHKDEYQQEELEVLEAYATCGAAHGFNFNNLKDGETAYNVQSYYYELLGARNEADEESIADSLVTDLLLTKAED